MICPLCQQELQIIPASNEPNVVDYVCPTKVSIFAESLNTHYRLSDWNEINEIMFVLPYRIISIHDQYQLSKQGDQSDYFCQWNVIVKVPKFPITSEQQLLTKIKTLITFS
jgi:hypothetical protein